MEEAGKAVAPGVTTDELDRIAHEYMCDHGAYPSTLDYLGFPKSLCTSVNEVICHGIPDSTVMESGDILNVDVTAFLGGVHGDTLTGTEADDLVGEVVAVGLDGDDVGDVVALDEDEVVPAAASSRAYS